MAGERGRPGGGGGPTPILPPVAEVEGLEVTRAGAALVAADAV